MQANCLPNLWRYVTFDNVIDLTSRLSAKPLTDSPNAPVKLFRRKSVSIDGVDAIRSFIDWRKAFTILVLMAGQLPSTEEVQGYCSKLRAQVTISEDGLLTKDAFVNVSNAYFSSSR